MLIDYYSILQIKYTLKEVINILLYEIVASDVHRKLLKPYNNNKLELSEPTWSDKFEYSDGSFSVSDIQGHFKCMIKKDKKVTDNLPIRIYL